MAIRCWRVAKRSKIFALLIGLGILMAAIGGLMNVAYIGMGKPNGLAAT